MFNVTTYQQETLERVKQGESILLVAPTGLGKTFAVTGDVCDQFCKVVYAVPLRALGEDVRRGILKLERNGQPIKTVIHHGSIQESSLFGEEFIVTTYDQVICGVPGLPLSLPLKAGHAVAGALLMSRLIFDEAHLAWGISEQALSILLAIVKFRKNYGLQTVLMTATLPDAVSNLLSAELGVERIMVGEGGEVEQDEALSERDKNRQVTPEMLEIRKVRQGKGLDLDPLDNLLKQEGQGRSIYFANTVDRIQATYDRLVQGGVDQRRISVLHNRMPHAWRKEVEAKVKARFGKEAEDGDWILLTNQVAEAGLDISAPLVVTDPAPVDTLVQRAGRCARWFREGVTKGRFFVIKPPGLKIEAPSQEAKDYVSPYMMKLAVPAINFFPKANLSWAEERRWVNSAWGGGEKEAQKAVERALLETTFALNLFDRAAQERRPGEIASVFRQILSIEVAVESGDAIRYDDLADNRDLQSLLDKDWFPDTSSISLGKAYGLMKAASGRAAVIRYAREENQFQIRQPDTIQLGDVLILPSSIAYLHRQKGLCFDDRRDEDAILSSEWTDLKKNKKNFSPGLSHRQTLSDHTTLVMEGTYNRLITREHLYRKTLISILRKLENKDDVEELADLIANLARVAAGFHDFGKADVRWQRKIRQLDPESAPGLVGRSCSTGGRIGIPHTPPGYVATVKACRMLLGYADGASPLDSIIRAVALATCRHHSSLLNPARVDYQFQPHPEAKDFVREVLAKVGASPDVISRADEIVEAAKTLPSPDEVPLMLPNEDLFPVYALVGRAILMADREDASREQQEQVG